MSPQKPTVPPPVAAALGLLPTVVDKAKKIPGKAAQAPGAAVMTALTALGTAKKGYDELAERGERLVSQLRGTSFDDVEDRVEDALQGTPLAKPYDRVEDALEDAGEKVSSIVSKARRKAPATPAVPEAEAPKGEPTPSAPTGGVDRVDTAATPEVVETVEAVVADVEVPEITSHDELPLPDYDHMTLGSLRGRLRSLSVEELVQVRDYEKAHANRLPVVTLLDNRIAKLATDETASPSPGGEAPVLPVPDSTSRATKPSRAKTGAPPRGKVRLT